MVCVLPFPSPSLLVWVLRLPFHFHSPDVSSFWPQFNKHSLCLLLWNNSCLWTIKSNLNYIGFICSSLFIYNINLFQFYYLYTTGVAAAIKRNVPFNLVAEEILDTSCPRLECYDFRVGRKIMVSLTNTLSLESYFTR